MTTPTTPNTKQELREKIINGLVIVQHKDYFARKGEIVPSHEQIEFVEQLLTDTVNKVLDEAKQKIHELPTWETSTMIDSEDALSAIEQVRGQFNGEPKKQCERFFACGNYVEGNGWGLNHNYCSLECKRKDDDWL